jgi:hypothetical protein
MNHFYRKPIFLGIILVAALLAGCQNPIAPPEQAALPQAGERATGNGGGVAGSVSGNANTVIYVSNTADSGTGSLRQAILDALASTDPSLVIEVVGTAQGGVIELLRPLEAITKSLTIEGAGVTLTPAATWVPDLPSPLLNISSSYKVEVTVRRVHFKDGRAQGYGGAIRNLGSLTLESCIFSGNESGSFMYDDGGAIYSANNDLTIRGCTFYGNRATNEGGAVYFAARDKYLTLTGNIFYGNSAPNYPVVRVNGGTVDPSYNVVDLPFGTTSTQCGWDAGTGDILVTSPSIWPVDFSLLCQSGAAGILPSVLPTGYPTEDFYGSAISGGGAAGAVQSSVTSGYYYVELSVNDSSRGTIASDPPPDPDGFYQEGSTFAIAATPIDTDYVFSSWLINGAPGGSTNPLTIASLDANLSVEAVFGRKITVDSSADTGPGTLRYALANAEDDDVITFSGVTPGTTTIALESALPNITVSLVIEGEGITLTPAASWAANASHLLFIADNAAKVTIRRVHFKNGVDTVMGGAIANQGYLTLESCIFSGNNAGESIVAAPNATGGAIYSSNTLIIRGCTFYANHSNYYAGAVFFTGPGDVLTLTGNLFYENIAVQAFPIVRVDNIAGIDPSYNVVDKDFGPGTVIEDECGWDAGPGDTNLTTLGITGAPFDTTTFVPIPDPGLNSVLPTSPEDFPVTDFYGTIRSFPGAPGAVAEDPGP